MRFLPFPLVLLLTLFEGSLADRSFVKCAGCATAVEGLKYVYGKNFTRDAVINIAAFVCEHFVKEESLVCRGLAAQYREELLYVLEQLLSKPTALCGVLIANCGHGYYPFDNWNITLPPNPKNPVYPSYPVKRKENLRILQLTDLHIDNQYTPGSVVNCPTYICCQPNSIQNGTEKIEAGYWGSHGTCDMPYWTIENMLQQINRTEKFDYIMISGDYVAHSDWDYTKDHHLTIIKNLTEMINTYFPNTPKYWTIGNHDSVPLNSFAPHYVPKKYQPNWVYQQLWEMQRDWVKSAQQSMVEFRGSFTTQLMEGLRLISLNTGYCETTNFWIYVNETDPDGTMSWLVEELARAEAQGHYVHILAHIPPGNVECLEGWARNYYKVVNRFRNTIVGQFFGHIHVDSFTIFYENMNDDASEPTNFMFSSPSVTTYARLNPAYRIYEIRPGNRYWHQFQEIVDYSTYFLNLSRANGMKELQWELLYSAKQEYGLQEITPKTMNELVDRLTVDSDLFEKFVRNSVRRDDYFCDEKCRYKTLCTLKKAHHNDALCAYLAGSEYDPGYDPVFTASDRLQTKILEKYFYSNVSAEAEISNRSKQLILDSKAVLKKTLLRMLKSSEKL